MKVLVIWLYYMIMGNNCWRFIQEGRLSQTSFMQKAIHQYFWGVIRDQRNIILSCVWWKIKRKNIYKSDEKWYLVMSMIVWELRRRKWRYEWNGESVCGGKNVFKTLSSRRNHMQYKNMLTYFKVSIEEEIIKEWK